MVRVVVASVLAALCALSSALSPLLVQRDTKLENLRFHERQDQLESTSAIKDEWFTKQLVDHRDSCGAPAYWKQRFHVNDEYYKGPGSPVFLYIHGENVAETGYVTSKGMFIVKEAEKYGALLVALEHRFYGESQPTSDMSTANLQYHTADQALADIATFQDYFTAQRNISAASPWVAFGGSYPGMLAGWTKFKYPTRFAGSVASSAPIDIKADFYGYMNIVAKGIQTVGGDECTKTLSEGLKAFHALVASDKPDDLAQLNKLFKPCSPMKTDLDKMDIESNVMGAYQGFAQNNDWANGLKTACKDLTAKDGLSPLEKVAKVNLKAYPTCTGSNYQDDWVTPLSNPKTDTVNIMRQWVFQTCNEFGFGQTAKKSTGPFSALEYVTVERVYYQMCKDVYGITNTDDRIAAKRATFHGLDIDVENVVWPSGSLDPWSDLVFDDKVKPVNAKSKVVYIDGTSHCGDMYAPSSRDSPALVAAHEQIDAAIASYVQK